MSKFLNVALLGLSLALVSCGHFGGKKCCGDKAKCSTEKSCCKDGQCDVKKKEQKKKQ